MFDDLAQASLLLSWFERRMRLRPTFLMYHRILPAAQCRSYPFSSLAMPTEAFEQQIAWLARRCELVSAGEAGRRMQSARIPAPRPVVAITFDDGYADNYEVAATILERHGVRGTFFIASDFVGANQLLWYDHAALLVAGSDDGQLCRSAETCGMGSPSAQDLARDRVAAWVGLLKRTAPHERTRWIADVATSQAPRPCESYRAMRPEDVADLARRGHEIGSHSVGHEILPLLDDEALAAELLRSREVIARWIGREVSGFCYPNGSHDERVVAATRAAGYAYACTNRPPSGDSAGDVLRLPRIDLTPSRVTRPDGQFDLLAFRAEISGLHALLR